MSRRVSNHGRRVYIGSCTTVPNSQASFHEIEYRISDIIKVAKTCQRPGVKEQADKLRINLMQVETVENARMHRVCRGLS